MIEINRYPSVSLKVFMQEITELSMARIYFRRYCILMMAHTHYLTFREHGQRNDTGWTARWSWLSISHKLFHC